MKTQFLSTLFLSLSLINYSIAQELTKEQKIEKYQREQSARCEKATQKIDEDLNKQNLSIEEFQKKKLFLYARTYFEYQIYERSIEYYEKYIDLIGEENIQNKLVWSNLRRAYVNNSNFEKGLVIIDKEMKTALKEDGPNSRAVADLNMQIGYIYKGMQSYDKARDYIEKKLNYWLKDGSHPHVVAQQYEIIASFYQEEGDLNKAETNFLTAVEYYNKAYGENNGYDFKLVDFYLKTNQFEKYKAIVEPKIESMKQSIITLENIRGKDAPDVIRALTQLKDVYNNLNNSQGVKELEEIIEERDSKELSEKEIFSRGVAMQNHVKFSQSEITLHGKVIDQNSNPVSGAELDFNYRSYDPKTLIRSNKTEIKTDIDGRFILTGIVGTELFLKNIVKENHEYHRLENQTSFKFQKGHNKLHKSSIDNPTIFSLRCFDKTIYLIRKKPRSVRVSKNESKNLWYDFTTGRFETKKINKPTFNLIIDYTNDKVCKVFMQSITDSGGFVIQEKEFYLAPDEYEKNIEISTEIEKYKKNANQKLYVSFKTSYPTMYSKMFIEVSLSLENCYINTEITTNPYGSKLLEYEKGFAYESLTKLENNAIKALSVGKYADINLFNQLFKSK